MTESAKSNLIGKLAEACDAVGGIEKKGKNEKQGYKYIKAADVAKAIRHELFSRGVVILQDEETCDYSQYATKSGGLMNECRVRVGYHITDGTETVIMHGIGVGSDSFDKAIYKAKTGALKYFLRGLGLIPDEKDDPEHDTKPGDERIDEEVGEIPDGKGITLNGIVLEEKATDIWVWYKLKTLTNDGETDVYVKSLAETDTGRLADRVGWIVSLKVRPVSTSRAGVFVLLDVLEVRKPKETQPQQEDPQTITAEDEQVATQAPTDLVITAPQLRKLQALRRERGIPEAQYRELLGRNGYEHSNEIQRKHFDAILAEVAAYCV